MHKLLLVEDDEFSRDMLSRRLERQGFETIVAADGREGVQAARTQRPDIIVMDLDMPVMDGHSAIRALQNDPRTFKIPIIVLTAHCSPDDLEQAVASGCRFFETKPIVLKRLIERINAILPPPPAPADGTQKLPDAVPETEHMPAVTEAPLKPRAD